MRTGLSRLLSLAALLSSAWLTSASAASIVFSDGDFSTWSSSTIFGTAGGQTVVRQTSGGNPSAYLSVSTVTYDTTFTGFFAPTFVYNPALGAITSIVSSIDFRNIASIGQGQAVALTLKQGSSYYRAGPFITGSSNFAWQGNGPTTFVLSDFVRLTGSGTLDFSASGAPISVGFSTGNSGGYGINVGYDNFSATLNTAAVPVPAAGWLLMSALGTLGALRGRTRQSQAA